MRRMKRLLNQLSIKQKWTIVTASTIVVSYALISGMLYIAINNWLINDEQQTAERTASDVQSFFLDEGSRITLGDIKKNTSLINAILDKAQTVRIYNQDHVEIIRINNSYLAPKEKPHLADIMQGKLIKTTLEDTQAFVIYKPIQIGVFHGYIELIHPISKYEAMMQYLLTTLVILGVGAVLIASALSRYIAVLLLRPIQQLRDSMVSVKDYGLSQKPNLTYEANDEIGDLLTIYNSMLAELERVFLQQQQFVQDASHELRTPIQAIEGHLSMLDRWGKKDSVILDESLQTSLQEVRRMKKLMEELLQLARNEEHNSGAVADVEFVLNEVITELQFLYESAKFEIHVQGDKATAVVSEQALHQILRNSIENALNYSNGDPVVSITVEYIGNNVLVEVRDYGIGISEEHLPHIFNRFYRVDDARTNVTGSTGLGLSITKMLADKYKLQLEVESEVHVGTTFKVSVPMKRAL